MGSKLRRNPKMEYNMTPTNYLKHFYYRSEQPHSLFWWLKPHSGGGKARKRLKLVKDGQNDAILASKWPRNPKWSIL